MLARREARPLSIFSFRFSILNTQDSEADSEISVTTIPPPPILKTWRRLYSAVLLFLALEVVLFYALTRSFF